MTQFVSQPITKSYLVKGHKIKLQLEPGVFCPSEHGSKLMNYISINKGERVLDMGTGTGIFGIVAAKEGGIVDVSDPSEQAINLAIKNAQLNKVKLRGYVGEYFCTPQQTYDYIIANLPQEIIPKKYAQEIGELEKTINGGSKGNTQLLAFLKQAHTHMNDKSRALIIAYFMGDYFSTLQKIKSLYFPKLLDVIISPAKDFVQDNISFYNSLIKKGDIGLFKKEGVWQSAMLIYELRKK